MILSRRNFSSVSHARLAAALLSVSAMALLVCLAPLRAEASTWTPVLNDDFHRADTVVSPTPGTTDGVGNNWTDTAGGMWNISSNQLQGSTADNSDYLSKFLVRPSSEAATDTRMIVRIPANESLGNAILGVGLRKQSASNDYYMAIITTNSMWIYRNIGGFGNYFAISYPTLNASHAYSIDFSAMGTYPTRLSLVVTDLTASSSPATLTTTDSSPELQLAGAPTLTAFNNGASTVHAAGVQTFVNTDTSAPVISAIATTTTLTTATITWTTDETSTSTVEYGTSTSYASASTSASFVTSHSIKLAGLTASTTYHYRVSSLDDTGNLATSTDLTFSTPTLTNPVAYWKFDETSSTSDAVDSNGSNTGSQSGSPIATTTVPYVNFSDTGSRGFDGTNYFTVARPVQDDFTICAWIKTASTGGGTHHWESAPIMDSETGGLAYDFGFGIGNGGRLMYGNGGTYDTQVNGTTVVNDNVWHNVCATRNKTSGAVKLYVDAVLDGSGTASGGTLSSNANARIGYGYDGAAHYVGLMDDIRVYGTDLSQTQLLSIFQGNNDPTTPPTDASSGGCSSVATTVGGLTYTTRCGVTTVTGSNTLALPTYGARSQVQGAAATFPEAPASAGVRASAISAVPSLSQSSGASSTIAASQASVSNFSAYQFPRNLKKGMAGDDVMKLQRFLNGHGFALAASGAGAPGSETGLFSGKTEAAVMRFQSANNAAILSPQNFAKPTGWFYGYTRGFANRMLLEGK